MRRLFIFLCFFGVGVLLLLVLRAARGPASEMDEPEREPYTEPEPVEEPEPVVESEPEPYAEPEPVVESEPEPVAEAEPEPAAEAGQETEEIPVVDLPDEDVVAPSAQGDDGKGRMAEMAALRDEIVERVERRPLFVMAEERNVPYFRLFFMTKLELLDAILEVEHVPPPDVMPSQEALERIREIAAEAYRRHEEIAAEEAELGSQA
ncbi:MAG TPA: hypothetical protein VNS99_03705, partial [Gaiellales bacterium]|nr:hypothetical protein [Gaiellales bacterium]